MIHPFKHERAASLEHALAALADGATVYAGGTELLAAMKVGLLAPDHIVDLKGLAELRGIRADGASWVIGSATPHAEVAAAHELQARLPMLAKVAAGIGNPRVRWQGTVGGNLCFAEPRSDLIPALLAYGATLRLRNRKGTREMSMEQFISGPFTTERAEDELLTEVQIGGEDIVYQAYERVRLMERPTVGVALVGRRSGWRLAVGAAGYLPVWRDAASHADIDVAEITNSVEPIEDSAGSADYKRHLVRVLVDRLLASAQGELS